MAYRKTVLFYFGGFAPVGGIETFCKTLLHYLDAKGYFCRLLCWGQRSSLLKELEESSVEITRLSWRWGCKWKLPDWLLLSLGLLYVSRSDVVLLGKLFPYTILEKIKRSARNKASLVYITPYKPDVPDCVVLKNSLSNTLNLFDLILVQSGTFSEDLRTIGYTGNISVIPYLSSGEFQAKPLPVEEDLKVGFLGRLVHDKNLPLLLQSFLCFNQQYHLKTGRFATLHLFGDGCLRDDLELLSHKLGLESNVFFHGSISREKVEDMIASCHLFLFTSHREGQCLAALEILSCGRPIVTSPAGAFPEILSDSRFGLLVSKTSPQEMASAMLKITSLLENEEMTSDTIRRAYFERYNAEHIGNQYVRLLNALC